MEHGKHMMPEKHKAMPKDMPHKPMAKPGHKGPMKRGKK